MKPGDLFLRTADVFATLVPGAIAAYLLRDLAALAFGYLVFERGGAAAWVAFLLGAFLLGHILSALGSLSFDWLYDRYYVRWRRASAAYVRSQLGTGASWRRVLARRIDLVQNCKNPDDALLIAARTLKRRQLAALAEEAGVDADDISNAYWWAGSMVRGAASPGTVEVDSLSAQSKLFRSLTLVVPIAAARAGLLGLAAFVGWLLLAALCLWCFLRLRWDCTGRTYEYYIATRLPAGAGNGEDHGTAG